MVEMKALLPPLSIGAGAIFDAFILSRIFIHRGCFVCWSWMSFLLLLFLVGLILVIVGVEQYGYGGKR